MFRTTVFSYVLIPVIFCTASCEEQIETLPDDILHQDVSPDLTIHSVLGYRFNLDWLSCGDFPIPTDSAITYPIDVNGDSIDDFVLSVTHYEGQQQTVHCPPVVFYITLSGVNEENQISLDMKQLFGYEARCFDTTLNDVINYLGKWNRYAVLSSRSFGTNGPRTVNLLSGYLGVRVKNSYGWIRVAPAEINGIILKEIAFNRTEFNSISAGQRY